MKSRIRGNRASDMFLQEKMIIEVPVVTGCPFTLVGKAIDQARRNAHPHCGLQDSTFQHAICAEFLSDSGQRLARTFVLHAGGPRDDAQQTIRREIRNKEFGNSIGERILVLYATQVLEREHR